MSTLCLVRRHCRTHPLSKVTPRLRLQCSLLFFPFNLYHHLHHHHRRHQLHQWFPCSFVCCFCLFSPSVAFVWGWGAGGVFFLSIINHRLSSTIPRPPLHRLLTLSRALPTVVVTDAGAIKAASRSDLLRYFFDVVRPCFCAHVVLFSLVLFNP